MTFVLSSGDFIYMLTHTEDIINIKYVRPSEHHYTYIYEFKPFDLSSWNYVPVVNDNKIYYRGIMIDPINHTYLKQSCPVLTFPKHITLKPKSVLKDVQSNYYITETPFIKYEIKRLSDDSTIINFKSDQFITFEHVLLCGNYALLKCFQFVAGVDYVKELYGCTSSVFGYDIVKFE